MDHTTIVATLPTDGLPEAGDLVLVEVWDGPTPPAVTEGAVEFLVEGTVIGDGRSWRGARYTPVDTIPDLTVGSDKHQLIVVRPLVSQWR